MFDFVRNTAFDTWGYFGKVPASSGFAVKPGEHQNSYGGSVGGPILKDKLFFFASYEGFHYTNVSNTPQYITIPTLQERTGNFTDVLGTAQPNIINPADSAHKPFQGLLNGVPTYNVIETQYLSSISLYLQSALPQPTNLSTFNNYLANLPQANTDYSIDGRLDYTINQRNKFSIVGVGGNIVTELRRRSLLQHAGLKLPLAVRQRASSPTRRPRRAFCPMSISHRNR